MLQKEKKAKKQQSGLVVFKQQNVYKIPILVDEEAIKKSQIDRIKVRVSTGKVFYADPTSRADIADAIDLAVEENRTTAPWKLAEEFEGNKIAIVTLEEFKEARRLGLAAKGSIIGVTE